MADTHDPTPPTIPEPSASKGVVVDAPAATATASAGEVTLKMASNLWITWASVAIEEARAARDARARLEQLLRGGADPDTLPEMKAALKSAGAASFALDSLDNLLGSLGVSEPTRSSVGTYLPGDVPRNRGDWVTRRLEISFTEAAALGLGPDAHDLFELRNDGVHHHVVMRPPTRHALGLNTTLEVATYTTELADQFAVRLVGVFAMVMDSDSPFAAVRHAFIGYRPALERWLYDADDFRP